MSRDESNTGDVQMRLRSAIPGRERWEVDALHRSPALAATIEELLPTEPGIVSVLANPLTGRVLICFNSELTQAQVETTLRTAVATALAKVGTPVPHRARAPRAASKSTPGSFAKPALLATGAAVLTAPLMLGAAGLTSPLLIGGGALLTALLAIRWWRRRRLALNTAASTSPRPLLRLLGYAGHHRRRVYLAIACSIVDKLMDLVPPVLIGLALNAVVNPAGSILAVFGLASAQAQVLALGGLTVLSWGVETAFGFAHRMLWHQLAQTLQHELRRDAYAHVQKLEIGFHEDQSTGELALILNEDINQLQLFISDEINHLIQVTTNVVVIGGVFFLLAPTVAWIALLPVPIVTWGWLRYQALVRPLYVEVRERAGILGDQLVNNLGGIATIKNFATEEHESERIRKLSQNYVDSNRPAILFNSAFAPLIRLAILVGFGGTLVIGGLLVTSGTLLPGTYATMIFLTQRFLWPLTSLGRTVDRYQKTMASIDRVFDLLAVPPTTEDGGHPLPFGAVRGEVVFENVSFAYPESPPVLHDFSLRIPSAATIGIVGATGAGKTTLIKLLLHHYKLAAGRILIDGHDIRELRRDDLRSAIGVVSQEPFLFAGSVRENITYGSFDRDFEAVAEAASLAEAHAFIQELPQQYETLVGERGVKLSGGQRQRLCIARAILKKPPILILDEATSAVDNETEAAIQRSLRRISKGRTTLIIAHRLSTVRQAETIYVLGRNGGILEQGRHEELLQQGGFYASLWAVQSGSSGDEPAH